MKILYLCHRFPFPPKRGGKIRPFNMIRHFAASGHRVTVCSLARSAEEAREGAGLAGHCAGYRLIQVSNPVQALRMVARLPTPVPSTLGFFFSPEMRRTVRALLDEEHYDLIFVHCSSVAQYVEHVQGIPKVLDFGDMDSQKWLEYAQYKPFPLSIGYWLEGVKMQREEMRLARKFDLCTATTRAEHDTLRGYGVDAETAWFPNGVDAEFFRPDGQGYDADTLSFIGRMDYYPNQECMIEFCRETLPLLRARRPAVKLLIVGADPSPAIRRLGEIPGVTVTGSVADVRPFVLRSCAMVAPLNIARGTQNKILEAMAMGVPVITSSAGAGGVDAERGEHLLVADSPEQIASAAAKLMEDPAARMRLAHAARERVLSNHSWRASMQRLDDILARFVPQDDHRPKRVPAPSTLPTAIES